MSIQSWYTTHLHQRLPWYVTLLFMLPMLALVWLPAREPVISVFNGSVPRWILEGHLFSGEFYRGHAGSALDQPTIGRSLFWFTSAGAIALPYALVVGLLSNRRRTSGYLAYGACAVVLGVFLLCILSWAACWLVQYVYAMGYTPRRLYGMLYAAFGGLAVVAFMAWSLIPPRNRLQVSQASPGPNGDGGSWLQEGDKQA